MSKIPSPLFDALLRTFRRRGIVRDSRQLYEQFHKDSANPQDFFHFLSPAEVAQLEQREQKLDTAHDAIRLSGPPSSFLRLVAKRRSTRLFRDARISLRVLGGLLASVYGFHLRRSTPSAGALYPLSIYVAVISHRQSLPYGLYRYDPAQKTVLPLELSLDWERLVLALDTDDLVRHAAFVVFVSADLEVHPAKYANRGYRYSLLEAGHATQNAYLYCAEQGLGIVEYGGFNDERVARLLGLRYPKEAVVITLVVGKPGRADVSFRPKTVMAQELFAALVGQARPVEWVRLGSLKYRSHEFPLVTAVAKYVVSSPAANRDESRDLAFATGRTSADAIIKVLAESYERHACSALRIDHVGSVETLRGQYLDPRVVTPLEPRQYQLLSDLEPFREDRRWQWVRGTRLQSGEEVLVAVDNVFFPLTSQLLGRKPCVRANSSGVAAHTERDIAVRNAFLELLERDAVAVTWYTRRPVAAVPLAALPASVGQRVKFWMRHGRQVVVLDLTLDSVPIFMVLIWSAQSYPCLVSGAGAAFDAEEALAKAWNEAELMLLSWLKSGRKVVPQPHKVAAPHQHGLLYFRPTNLRQVRWLLSTKCTTRVLERRRTLQSLTWRFEPVMVDITPRDRPHSFSVVRVLSESLLPLNFGYGSEHRNHPRCRVLNLRWVRRFPAFPHFFA